jgi:uncharacterized membrane protein
VIINTVKTNGVALIMDSLGGSLGWLNIHVPQIILLPYLVLLLLCAVVTRNDTKFFLSIKDKLIIFLAVAMVVALIFTSLYVQWTSYQAPLVAGVQGRYFIPVAFLGCAFISNKYIKIENINYEQYIYPFLGYIHLISLLAIIKSMV